MNAQKVKRKYKYKNIAAALAVILILTLIISTSCHRNNSEDGNKKTQINASDELSSMADDSSSKEIRLTKNYKYEALDNKSDLCKGKLVIIDADHPFKGQPENLDTIYSYLFDENSNQIIYASGSDLTANKDLFDQFNNLAADFYKEKGLATLLVSSAYSGVNSQKENSDETSDESSGSDNDSGPKAENSVDEAATGLTLDIQLYDSAGGTYPEYTGEGEYAWITDNCYKYGLILRYPGEKPNHFRYVGNVYSEIMHSKNLTLEKFNDFIKDYTFEKPFSYAAESGNDYFIYYVKAESEDKTNVPIPQKDDGSEYKYEISGNNIDGYVVCVTVSEDKNEALSEDSSSSESNDSDDELSESSDLNQ